MSLKSDAAEQAGMVRQCKEKSRELAKLEKHLAIERRLVIEQKKKLEKEFVNKKNLKVIYLSLCSLGEEYGKLVHRLHTSSCH